MPRHKNMRKVKLALLYVQTGLVPHKHARWQSLVSVPTDTCTLSIMISVQDSRVLQPGLCYCQGMRRGTTASAFFPNRWKTMRKL